MSAGTGYPMSLYVYDAEGRHHGAVPIGNDLALQVAFATAVREAIDARREVRIADSDDFLVFHAVDGRIIWPTREAVAEAEATARGAS